MKHRRRGVPLAVLNRLDGAKRVWRLAQCVGDCLLEWERLDGGSRDWHRPAKRWPTGAIKTRAARGLGASSTARSPSATSSSAARASDRPSSN